jgi:hypothetical protein
MTTRKNAEPPQRPEAVLIFNSQGQQSQPECASAALIALHKTSNLI